MPPLADRDAAVEATPPMLSHAFEKSLKALSGGFLLGEIMTFFSGDKVQQAGLLIAGALTWGAHYLWSQRKEKRNDRDAEERSRRTNRLLNALERRVRASIEAREPLPYPELVHLIADRDLPGGDVAEK
jgi:hypothetical protein